MYRAMGSLAFVAAARSVWVVTKDEQDPTSQLAWLRYENDLANVDSMSYRVVEVNGVAVWPRD